MNKYWHTLIGIIVFLLLIFTLGYIDGLIMEWSRQNYQFHKGDFYISFVKLFMLPLAVVLLGIAHALRASKFDWKFFLIFLVLGSVILFKLLVYIPMPVNYKMFIVKYSDIGGIIIGLGIILSLESRREGDKKRG